MPEIRHSPHRFEIPRSGIMEVSMKINEVEQQVGITKKNIRFYEQQGDRKSTRLNSSHA